MVKNLKQSILHLFEIANKYTWPLLIFNLILRIITHLYVVINKNWLSGDSYFYLDTAHKICSGQFGGDPIRPPLYSWFLCLTSPQIFNHAGTKDLFLPLLIQSLLPWFIAAYLAKKINLIENIQKKNILSFLAIYCAYEPLFYELSFSVMSDLFFGFFVFFIGKNAHNVFSTNSKKLPSFLFGLFFGLASLTRAIAVPLFYCSLLVLFFTTYLNKKYLNNLITILLIITGFLLVTTPLYIWNYNQHHKIFLSKQGNDWIHSVAAAVEYYPIDFYQADQKWNDLGYHNDPSKPYLTILKKWPTWFFLTFKGIIRTLFGHVNVQWAYLITGDAPIGPAWFKPPESRSSLNQVQGFLPILLWLIGILFTTTSSSILYFLGIKKLFQKSYTNSFFKNTYRYYILFSSFYFIFIPQLWGEARFRVPVIALLMSVLYLFSTSKNKIEPHLE